MSVLSFKPKTITKKLLSVLNNRNSDIVTKRYGLSSGKKQTLESIGQEYGITRERVRQIENAALSAIRKSQEFSEIQGEMFSELEDVLHDLGGLVEEQNLLEHMSEDSVMQSHLNLHLTLGDNFKHHKENEHFHSRWSVNSEIEDTVHTALSDLYGNLSSEEIIKESELLERFLTQLQEVNDHYKNDATARRWIQISKKVKSNPLGDWGRTDSANIKTRGIRDYAYLTMRKHGSPLHFREVADNITEMFDKKTNHATCHNELIKDDRFVLIGRGLYALSEWGYEPGVARDVVKNILEKEGPMTKEEIVDKVMKERYFKRNTILVNLHNKKHFKKDKDGRYSPVK
ncbi:MAG: hypothetical protein ACI9AR_000169 [Flavobacteriaceae bacterium]|jgi:hypothetical protein